MFLYILLNACGGIKMTYPEIRKNINKNLDLLPFEMQKMVQEFAHNLVISLPKGMDGKKLLRFSGCMESKDIQEISQAIEEYCEKVDGHH
jgi:hypothetical protein